jgi:hypothetical protein
MRGLLPAGAVIVMASVRTVFPAQPPQGCFVATVAVIVDSVRDVRDIKYHRMAVSGIRKLEPAADASEMGCEPRDAVVLAEMRRAVESRFQGVVIVPPKAQFTYTLRHSTIEVVRNEIKRLAAVARQHSGSFTRVEVVPLDVPEAPRSRELPLPALTASEAEAAACNTDNAALARAGAKYRWAC